MQVICLEDAAFYELLDALTERIKKLSAQPSKKWISSEEAKTKLQIKATSTLQMLRDTGAIRFTHPQKRIILYDSDSIDEYLEKHAKSTF